MTLHRLFPPIRPFTIPPSATRREPGHLQAALWPALWSALWSASSLACLVTPGSGASIQAQRFDWDGTPLADEFQVNRLRRRVRPLPGRRRRPTNACVLFSDGFESGDTTGWAITVP